MSDFIVFPNPTAGDVWLNTEVSMKGNRYIISDQSGSVVMSGTIEGEQTKIRLGILPAGIYLIPAGDGQKQTFVVLKN